MKLPISSGELLSPLNMERIKGSGVLKFVWMWSVAKYS